MMNTNPPIGAIAYGRSGVAGIVTDIESDRVVLRFPDGQKKRVPVAAIARWELPAPKVIFPAVVQVIPQSRSPKHYQMLRGDRVKNLETGEIGILSIWYRDRSKAVIETDDGISDWISVKNLELVEAV